MVTLQDLSGLLENGVLEASNISIFLIQDRGTKQDPVTVFSLNVDSSVMDAVRSTAQSHLNDLLDTAQKEKIEAIPAYNPDHSQTIFQIPRETVEADSFTSLNSYLSGLKSPLPFQKENNRFDSLKAWVFRFEYELNDTIKQMYFFQKFQATKMLGKKKLIIFQSGGEFTLLEKDSLTLNEGMDFFLFEETFVVTKMYAFEKTLGYEAFYKESATRLVKSLDANKISGLDYQVKFCDLKNTLNSIQGNTRIAHKLYSAKANGYYRKINFTKLEDLNQRYQLQLDLDPDQKEWNIDGNADMQIVSQILNDDYSRSQLTELEYLTREKEKL